jgi:hypothetical protein
MPTDGTTELGLISNTMQQAAALAAAIISSLRAEMRLLSLAAVATLSTASYRSAGCKLGAALAGLELLACGMLLACNALLLPRLPNSRVCAACLVVVAGAAATANVTGAAVMALLRLPPSTQRARFLPLCPKEAVSRLQHCRSLSLSFSPGLSIL